MAGAIQTAGSDHWSSPPDLFQHQDSRYHFTIDGAASHDMDITVTNPDKTTRLVRAQANTLLPRWWGPGGIAEDALGVSWAGERVWCNPPFSLVDEFLLKAVEELENNGVLSVFLVKIATDKKIWRKTIGSHAGSVGEIEGRLTYIRPDGPSVGATFASCLVVFDPYHPQGWPPIRYSCDRLGNPLPLVIGGPRVI